MYNWLVFLHVFFALAFMLAHGVHATEVLSFRNEKDPERILAFFSMVPKTTLIRVLTVLMGVSGFIAAFITPWWRQGWVWTSAVVFLIISYIMYRYGGDYIGSTLDAAEHLIEARKTNTDVETALREFDEARTAPHPIVVSIVGMVGLAIILWLMRFKPF